MSQIENYVEQHKQRFLDELFALLRFASISADPRYAEEVAATADFVAHTLKQVGADRVDVANYFKGIETIPLFFRNFAELHNASA